MTKQTISKILEHLDGFPENKTSSLIDYIEFIKQRDILNIAGKKVQNTSNMAMYGEAGP